jgi:hypothetical protein
MFPAKVTIAITATMIMLGVYLLISSPFCVLQFSSEWSSSESVSSPFSELASSLSSEYN